MALRPGKTYDVGLDLGATLVKAVFVPEGRAVSAFDTFVCGARDTATLEAFLRSIRVGLVVATGGGAHRLAASPHPPLRAGEFDAWAAGERHLLESAGFVPSDPHLLVSLGTGTSILSIEVNGGVRRVGGTALGGGTIRGLGRLLIGETDHDTLIAYARQGDRRRVDLTVGEIYPPGEIALMPDLTASNFGKSLSRNPADLAAAAVGLVGENVALLAAAHAAILKATATGSKRFRRPARVDIVYAGSTLRGHEMLKDVLREVTALAGGEARFLPSGEFTGALGALSMAREGKALPPAPR